MAAKNNRRLNPEKLTQTAGELAEWIGKSFDNAHLATIAVEVEGFAREAVAIELESYLLRQSGCSASSFG